MPNPPLLTLLKRQHIREVCNERNMDLPNCVYQRRQHRVRPSSRKESTRECRSHTTSSLRTPDLAFQYLHPTERQQQAEVLTAGSKATTGFYLPQDSTREEILRRQRNGCKECVVALEREKHHECTKAAGKPSRAWNFARKIAHSDFCVPPIAHYE